MPNKKIPKNPQKYCCENCDYNTSNHKDFKKHEQTNKHKILTNPNKSYLENPQKQYSCSCGKKYKHNSTLSSHRKKCSIKNVNEDAITLKPIINENNDFKQIILAVINNTTELQKQNQELQKQFIELCKNNPTTTNLINNTNSHNKTFNLQFFLNEQCKDAMNLSDFVKSVTLQLSDLEHVGQMGYVEGISNIMIKKLNEMDIHKRPLHCSDAKRETLYVKDDNCWEKEGPEHIKLRKAIKYISKKNSDLLTSWSDNHPSSKNIHTSENDKYMVMIQQAMGGSGEIIENENKIIRKLAKVFLIDKL